MIDRYASHLPVLIALSWVLPMRRVLEFGSGLHSTGFFLGLNECETLVSVETDMGWRAKTSAAFPDERLVLQDFTPRNIAGAFDLVFIDDGTQAIERVGTIRWVLSQPHPPVVIHDAEVPEYRRAIEELSDNHFTFLTNPQVELVK